MAVALRATTQGTYDADGAQDIAWPTGSAAGDVAVVCFAEPESGVPNGKPADSTGWALCDSGTSTAIWWKRVTAADVAAALPVVGHVAMLSTFTGCGGVGNVAQTSNGTAGVTLTAAGAGLFVMCRGDMQSDALDPTSGKLHASDVVNLSNRSRRYNTWFVAHTTTGYKTLSGLDATYYSSLELVPSVGPDAPTLTSPAAGAQINPAAALTFGTVHNSTQGGTQDAIKLRIREVLTSTWYYLLADGTITATETAISTSSGSNTMDASTLTSGVTYEWTAATSEAGVYSSYATVQQVSAVAPPTVDSITVTAAAGDRTPTIAWTETMGVGSQIAYRVRVCPSADATPANPTWDSGVVSGAALTVDAPSDTAWTNGATLYAWVDVQQSGGVWSASTKDNATFAVSWTPPTAPSSVTAANQASGPLRVTVAGITAGYDGLEIQGSTDSGTTWTALASMVPDATSEAVDVPLAAYGVPTLYRARVLDNSTGVDLWSDWTTAAAAVASTDQGAYFVTEAGDDWMAVQIVEDSERRRVQPVAVWYPPAASLPSVDRGPAQGETGTLTLETETAADLAALLAWLDANAVWIMRWPPEGPPLADAGTTRMAQAEQVSYARPVQAQLSWRFFALQWVEQ